MALDGVGRNRVSARCNCACRSPASAVWHPPLKCSVGLGGPMSLSNESLLKPSVGLVPVKAGNHVARSPGIVVPTRYSDTRADEIAVISHELRNSLGVVRNAARLLRLSARGRQHRQLRAFSSSATSPRWPGTSKTCSRPPSPGGRRSRIAAFARRSANRRESFGAARSRRISRGAAMSPGRRACPSMRSGCTQTPRASSRCSRIS